MECLERREQPTAKDLREHLLEVHRRNAGFTETCAWASRDEAGRNSYEWLAELVDPAEHRHVVDLACGGGPLTALCQERYGKQVQLIGVDMSEHELQLARQRLAGTSAQFHQCMAQELHFLDDGSVDVVLCHWALTLMSPVEPVLEEVSRVLRPGGTFAAIVDGDMRQSPAYESIHHLIYDAVREEYPAYGEFDLGDARVRTSCSLATLVGAHLDQQVVRTEPGLVRLAAAPAELARVAAGFFYAAFVLSAPGHARMLRALEGFFAESATGTESLGTFAMPITRLVVTAPARSQRRRSA